MNYPALIREYVTGAIRCCGDDHAGLYDTLKGVAHQGHLWATRDESFVGDLACRIVEDAVSDPERWQTFEQMLGDALVAKDVASALPEGDLSMPTWESQLHSNPEFRQRVQQIADRLGVEHKEVLNELTAILKRALGVAHDLF